jgi:competence protein ComEC
MLFVFLGLCGGIWLNDSARLSPIVWGSIGVACAAVWLALWLRHNPLALAALCGALICLGGLRHDFHLASVQGGTRTLQAPTAPTPVVMEVIAITGARISAPAAPTPLEFMPQRSQTRVLVNVDRVRDGVDWQAASGRGWLVVQGKKEAIGAGDRLRIYGEISRRNSRGNPGEADRSRQMEIDGVQFYVRCESDSQVHILERGSTYSVARWIGFQRQAWIGKLHRAMGEKQGGLAAAILLGASEQLDSARLDSFLLVGMSHILVVSGANVAILVGALIWLQRVIGLPRWFALLSIAIFVLWFALLADADAPVMRATAVMLVLLLGQAMSRRVDSIQAWSAAGAAVLILNPAYLFSLGAQLSFLSVAILIQAAISHEPPRRISDPLDRLIFQSHSFAVRTLIRLREMLAEALRTSIWVWLATTPILWMQFGYLQWGPIILNPLLVFPFLITLWSGMIFLITDGFVPGVSSTMAMLCRGCLDVMEWLVSLFQGRNAPTMLLPPPPVWWAVAFYAATLFAAVGGLGRSRQSLLEPKSVRTMPRQGRRQWTLGIAAVLWLAIGIALGRSTSLGDGQNPLRLTFLNVGHGTCVLIDFPNNATWVYDSGNQSDGRGAARILWEALLTSRKSHIDQFLISHDDTDHYSAVPTLLRRVRVDKICWTRDLAEPQSASGKYLTEVVAEAGVTPEIVSEGASWQVDGVAIRVLHPSLSENFGSDNSRSIVLEIEYAGRRVLLPGDLETPGLELLLNRDTEPYDVVMAPHHGSERSAPSRFAGWSRPDFVIISGDEEDHRDSTIAAYAAGGAKVFHTADHGAIVLEISDQGAMQVQPYADSKLNPGF